MNEPDSTLEKHVTDIHCTAKPVKSPLGWVMAVVAISCVAGVTFPAIANLMTTGSAKHSPTLMQEATSIDTSAAPEAHLDAFAWSARVKLESLLLHQSIKISKTQNGGLQATGKITSGFAERYSVFLNWYRTRKNFPGLLDKVEVLKTSDTVPGVKSIWFGKEETVFFDDGSFGSTGNRLANGWEIVKIDRQAVTLQRNGTIVFLEYR